MKELQKFKNRITISSSNPTSEHISERNEITILKEYEHAMFIASITHNCQDRHGNHPNVNRFVTTQMDLKGHYAK